MPWAGGRLAGLVPCLGSYSLVASQAAPYLLQVKGKFLHFGCQRNPASHRHLPVLSCLSPSPYKLALLEKKRQLTTQLEDAKELQEHVAQRERVFFASVSRCLPSEQLQDYQHFVRMKSALAIQQRQLDDKIKLGEEQLRCLRESLRRAPRDC